MKPEGVINLSAFSIHLITSITFSDLMSVAYCPKSENICFTLVHFYNFLCQGGGPVISDLAITKTLEIIIPSKYLLGYKVFLKPRNKWFS